MTNEIQQTRYDRLVRRVTGIVGPGSKVSEVITELFPFINVEDPPGELLLLGGTQIAQGGSDIQSLALEHASAMLANPVQSGHIITVTGVVLTLLANGSVDFVTSALAPSGLPKTPTVRDTRVGAVQPPVGQVFFDSLAAPLGLQGRVRVLAGTPLVLQDPNGLVVLAPGTKYQFASLGVNQFLTANFWWRERPAEESELNL